MDYKIKKGARVILSILAGADRSLIGLKIGNSNIIEITESDFSQLVLCTFNEREYNAFIYSIFSHRARCDDNASFIVIETIETKETIFSNDVILCDLLKFYKAIDIFSCYSLSYRFDENTNTIKSGGNIKIVKYEHAIDHLPRKYILTDLEKEEFASWYDSHIGLVIGEKSPELRKMKELYLDSYLVGKVNPSFIMLFVVLEMEYGVDRKDILSRIRKGISKFIGKNDKERKRIRNDIHNLYDIRSKYVHDGEDVDWDSLFLLRDYVRRVIVKLYETGKH
ncbi:MAG: hypothetical protein ACI4YB_00515 [Oscillospiraceae bacterium]